MISVSDPQENVDLTPHDPQNTPEVDPPVVTQSTDPPIDPQTSDPIVEPQNKISTEPQGPELPTVSVIPGDKSGFDHETTIIEFSETMMSNIIDQELDQAINELAVDTVAENCA